ncbi:unnamed protein product [Thlaspi arvense]|uniref:Secreted protein n=1 Tax=Thlaspi arvense TaxID=13288 RepID=A0AAU9T5Y9_THLAR|nr:unnamed protein product [Thlaspi arvense]
MQILSTCSLGEIVSIQLLFTALSITSSSRTGQPDKSLRRKTNSDRNIKDNRWCNKDQRRASKFLEPGNYAIPLTCPQTS